MDRYKALTAVGGGRYGTVFKAAHRATGEIVAIKRMKRKVGSWDECMQLRECRRSAARPHIVKLKEVIREDEYFYLVFEYLDQNLDQLCKARAQREAPSRNRACATWSASCCRRSRTSTSEASSTATSSPRTSSSPERARSSSPTLGPRARFARGRRTLATLGRGGTAPPELLLRSTHYTASIDIWAVGTIMAELLALRPLFPGATEADQIHRITAVLGAPTAATWQQGIVLAQTRGVRFPKTDATPLAQLVPNASADALDLMKLAPALGPRHAADGGAGAQAPLLPTGPPGGAPARQDDGRGGRVDGEDGHARRAARRQRRGGGGAPVGRRRRLALHRFDGRAEGGRLGRLVARVARLAHGGADETA